MDGILAIAATLKYSVIDEIYAEDEYGSSILTKLQNARRFNKWIGDTPRPWVADWVIDRRRNRGR
jgi:hypothetical protein